MLSPLLESEKDLKVLDVFTGGGDCISKLPVNWKITANDLDIKLIEMHKAFQSGDITDSIIYDLYNEKGLSKVNEEAFYDLRSQYNTNPDPVLLYLLITSSFNNQLRFGPKGFNMPFGKNRSSYNPRMRKKVQNYTKSLQERSVVFTSKDCFDLNFRNYDLLILDPPYSNTVATYNETSCWNEETDQLLFDKIDSSGCKFIYFNQVVAKGITNRTLESWSRKYKIKVLKTTTDNCSYHKKASNGETIEVLVTNI